MTFECSTLVSPSRARISSFARYMSSKAENYDHLFYLCSPRYAPADNVC